MTRHLCYLCAGHTHIAVHSSSHRPRLMHELAPEFHRTSELHQAAIVADIKKARERGQSVLVLFNTIAESLTFSAQLKKLSIRHFVLNGEQKQPEEDILAKAGLPGAVTIATHIAGRGTDFKGYFHVIIAKLSQNSRVYGQGKGRGRGARQGEKGSCREIIAASDEFVKILLQGHELPEGIDPIAALKILRTRHVAAKSEWRMRRAAVDSDNFEVFEIFAQHLAQIKQNLESIDLEDVQTLCSHFSLRKQSTFESSDPAFKVMYAKANELLDRQCSGHRVDWSTFIADAKRFYLDGIKTTWAMFFSEAEGENLRALYDETLAVSIEVISGNTEACFKKCVESLLSQARAYQAENRAQAAHRFFLAPVAMGAEKRVEAALGVVDNGMTY